VDKLTLEYIVTNQATLIQDLDRRLGVVRDFVRQVADARATGLYLYGPAGTGKTRTVTSTLAKSLDCPYVYFRGHLTPIGLFELLAENQDEIIVLDDLSSVFESDIALQILLSALEPPAFRDRTRPVEYKRQGKRQVAQFRGGIICISNLELHGNELLDAFNSRTNTMKYDPSSAELGAFMLKVASLGYPATETSTMTPAEATDVARYVIEKILRIGSRFDLRLLVGKAFVSYQQVKDGEAESDWRDLVTATIEQHLLEPKHEGISLPTRKERMEEDRRILLEILQSHTKRDEQMSE